MNAILGLDISSTRTGVVLLSHPGRDILDRTNIRPTASWSTARRVDAMADSLAQWVSDPRVIDIWAEGIGTDKVNTAIAMGRAHQAIARMISVVSPLGRRIDQAYGEIAPNAVKKHAVGRAGRTVDKDVMVAAARVRWPNWSLTHDEVDAAYVAEIGSLTITKEFTP